jgi:hypothetical protein
MEKRTQGAWILHHSKKLLEFSNTSEFEDIELAGKCGAFLSNLAASNEQSDLNQDKVYAIAKISNIKKTEIDTIKKILEESKLIDIAKNGSISVIGITTSNVLSHTSDIFKEANPSSFQTAAIQLSENITDLPKGENVVREYISDNNRLSKAETNELFLQSEEIGFVDFEKLNDNSKLYFNGNLFRRENISKTNAVLKSLKADDIQHINELDHILTNSGCSTYENTLKILGDPLLQKLQSIGMYDFNIVSNSRESKVFITKPSAFSKYGNPFEEDALDLAKAFVSALYYGMHYSHSDRGKISMLRALLKKLINGYEVGPATAIGEDYKLLELKRVIQLRQDIGNKYYMKLLKRDVGEIALSVLEIGDATEQSIINPLIVSGSITNYVGPEKNRTIQRKKQNEPSKKSVVELLRTLRS